MIYRNVFKINKKNIFLSGGQSSMEFVLVLPLLIIIILVVSQLGYIVYLKNVLEHAAHEGARVLVTSNSNSTALDRIYGICSKMEKELLKIEFVPALHNQRQMGELAGVQIQYDYTGFAGLAELLSGKKFPLKSVCSMRMECSNE